jgi:sensor c-di-GMP phosphodiesterase-like protein
MRSIVPVRIAVVLASAAIAAVVAHFAAAAWIERGRINHITELNDVALRRSESAIDAGFAALRDLIAHTPIGCDPDALQAIRLGIYQRGTIKDIRIADRNGAVRCSAYPETLEFDLDWPRRNKMTEGLEPGTTLFRVEQFSSTALGLMQDYSPTSSLAAILSINATIFDIMPSELLGESEVSLALTNGERIMGFASRPGHEMDDAIAFTRTSTAYPIRTTIRIGKAAYTRWNREDYPLILALGILLGLVSGALLASLIGRPRNRIAEIDRGLAAREFKPYLQPIFDMHTGEIVGCEVLVRWIKGDMVIPPSRFIELAESSGRIGRMTWQILEPALRELREVTLERERFKISFNVTPELLVSEGFSAALDRIVRASGVAARHVVVEVTERDELQNPALACETVAHLHELGFRVAIDDVGIGHSGLSQIQRLGADIIKIDKFFVDLVARDTSATAVIEMLVKLARELKMTVVAEGIESPEQIAALIACGVTQGQGYIVSPPVPPRKFLELLAQPRSIPAPPIAPSAVPTAADTAAGMSADMAHVV